MRWACVLVAQVFPQWLDDMQKSGISDVSSGDGLSEHLSRFRRDLLCSAALHTKNSADRAISGEDRSTPRKPVGPPLFDLAAWHMYPKLCNGVFSLQEFLRVACETGKGLPLGVPHTKAKGRGENSDYTYSKFKSKLRRIREIFPVDNVERLEQFQTYHLEWLAVFLIISDWRPSSTQALYTPITSSRIALDNLRSQLGIPLSSSDSEPFFSTFFTSFPLFKGTLLRKFWRNRNI